MQFESTRWSLIVAAGGQDSVAARDALGALCETDWYPLYAFVRRRGADPDAAHDLTQGFLTSLLERNDFEHLRPDRGRFRAFLLASLKHFLANEAARRHTLKRGGGITFVPLAGDDAEGRYCREPADDQTPARLYERRWALTVIDRVMSELRAEWADSGRVRRAEAGPARGRAPGRIRGCRGALRDVGRPVKVAVHRLRRRFGSRLRSRIADTVANPADVDDEIAYLVQALRQ